MATRVEKLIIKFMWPNNLKSQTTNCGGATVYLRWSCGFNYGIRYADFEVVCTELMTQSSENCSGAENR